MGVNEKGNLEKIVYFIEHIKCTGEMRCHRDDPDVVG